MGRVAVIQLDFANVLPKKCGDSDFDKWYARSAGAECLMGHKVNVRFGCHSNVMLKGCREAMVQA